MLEAFREVDVMDGKSVLSSFEVRYRFSITAGVKARTWANAADGFHPAEAPTVDVREIAIRWHPSHQWQTVNGMAFDMLSADVPDEWFIDQAMEDAA